MQCYTLIAILIVATLSPGAYALNGGTVRVNGRNGWRAFEVISVGDNPAGDGFNWVMPGTNDGMGAWLPNAATLQLQINHENSDATISEVNLNLANFRTAIRNMVGVGNTGGVAFVDSARQAYGRWSNDGGANWIATADVSTTAFFRFCSGQSYVPNTYGPGRGFVDHVYLTGEEGSTNRLFALDSVNRDFYRLSGVTGSATGGIGGMPADSWENAALLDTGETNHVALLLSPDGGTQRLQLYIGEKGKSTTGAAATDFLARNGLAYGSYYYLNDTLPASGSSVDGFFDTTTAGALAATKMEDVDTSPTDPTQAVLGNENFGLFTLEFNLDFSSGSFSAAGSSFSITKIQQHVNGTDGQFGDADNVDWSAATTLGGVNYPSGLIFVNEDSETANGETWMMAHDGSGLTLIGDNIGLAGADESSGIVDISRLVGYRPGSILVTDNQGVNSSVTVLINPQATLLADYNANGIVDAADYSVWRDSLGQTGLGLPADGSGDGQINPGDFDTWAANFGATASAGSGAGIAVIPEPVSMALLALTLAAVRCNRGR
jgi:hypothetical protein